MKNLVYVLLIAPVLTFADTNFNIVSFDISFGGGNKDTKSLNILGYRQSISLLANQTETKEDQTIKRGLSPIAWVAIGAGVAALAISTSDDDDPVECTTPSFVFGSDVSGPVAVACQ